MTNEERSEEETTSKSQDRSLLKLLSILFKEIVRKKKWLLLPIWIFLAAMIIVLFFSGASYLIPAIYIAF